MNRPELQFTFAQTLAVFHVKQFSLVAHKVSNSPAPVSHGLCSSPVTSVAALHVVR